MCLQMIIYNIIITLLDCSWLVMRKGTCGRHMQMKWVWGHPGAKKKKKKIFTKPASFGSVRGSDMAWEESQGHDCDVFWRFSMQKKTRCPFSACDFSRKCSSSESILYATVTPDFQSETVKLVFYLYSVRFLHI